MTLHVVLGVSGGIAAYKSAEVVRRLVDGGATVQVLMTPAALRFLAPLTLSVLSRQPVVSDLWDPGSGAVDHVELARRADVFAVAPATADVLAKLAHGVADDVVTTYALAHRRAVVLAPAMNSWMWAHEATVSNLATLRGRGATVVGPDAGFLAEGEVGLGRLAEPETIAAAVVEAGATSASLGGRRVLVTAGPTREPIDPVRFLSNRSSGKMGFAIAREAVRRGAEVTLVSGPVALEPPAGATVVRVERTAEMRDAVLERLASVNALVMAAAPADFVAAAPAVRKLKRAAGIPDLALALAPDVLAAVAAARRADQVVVAFAAETENVLPNARKKLLDKGADLLVANDVGMPGVGFDADENEVVILGEAPDARAEDGSPEEIVPRGPKSLVARRVLDRLTRLLDSRCPRTAAATR